MYRLVNNIHSRLNTTFIGTLLRTHARDYYTSKASSAQFAVQSGACVRDKMDFSDSDGNENDSCVFSEDKLKALAGIRAGTAGICAVICLLAIIVICWIMRWKLFLHRILLYFTVATLLYLLAYVAEFATLSGSESACITVAFFDQLTSWLHLGFTVWMALYLFYLYCHGLFNPHGGMELWEPSKRLEAGCFIMIIGVAIVASFIPVPYAYGITGGWCWIRDRVHGGCKEYVVGKVEQFVLWYVWMFVSVVLIASLFCIALILTYKMARNYKIADKYYKQQAKQTATILFLYLGIYFVLSLIELIIRVYNSVYDYNFGTWVTVAIITPIGAVFLPLMFLVHLTCIGRIGRLANTKERQNLLADKCVNASVSS